MNDAGEPPSIPLIVPHLTFAHALPGAKRLEGDESGVNPTYVGLVDTGEQTVEAYIKILTPRQLANEIAASVLGHSLGMPLPKAFVVIGSPDDGYGDPAPVWEGGPERLLFASEAASGGDWRPVKRLSPYPIKPFLAWASLPVSVCFDEWLANVDRHTGNFLFDGAGKFLLIDHSHVFTGDAWVESALKSDGKWPNRLIEVWPGPMLTGAVKAKICAELPQHTTAFSKVDLSVLAHSPMPVLLTPSEIQAVTAFLSTRCAHLAATLPDRLGIAKAAP